MKNSKLKEVLEWLYCIIIAVVLALLVRYFVGTPTEVRQRSMYPTLIEEQRLILVRGVRTMHKTPKKGDIITFEAPSSFIASYETNEDNLIAEYKNEPKGIFNKFKYYVLEIGKTSYIKRVIGLPGERVTIKDGKVYINDSEQKGEPLNEPYLQEDVVTNPKGPFVDVVVPEGCVFVMGDNRAQSTDSRAFGCIPLEKIESKVWIRFWPLNLFGGVK